MPSKNFLLLSMEDEKIKKISNVISNESCRKILDYLSNKEATESELSEKLGVSISTVHNALILPRQAAAIIVTGRNFRVADKEKFLLLWATHRQLAKDIIFMQEI